MVVKTLDGCSYSQLWVSPANWQKATKKDLDKDWYVQCVFFDPRFDKKYPKGFPYRKKANKATTVEERKAMVSFLLKNIPKQLDAGYNPILKKYVQVHKDVNHIISLRELVDYIKNCYHNELVIVNAVVTSKHHRY